MPLRNRVTPGGDIIAAGGRGLMMGNRGVLHDKQLQLVREWAVKRWIACRLSFRGRYSPVLEPNRYTKLFFLDEVTALAAGHRPCAECRYADYQRFRRYWEAAFGSMESADAIDAVLHAERINGTAKRTWTTELRNLPDGTFVSIDGRAHLVWQGDLIEWSDSGYRSRLQKSAGAAVQVLTPPAIVAVLFAGYAAEVHPSISAG